ncbi:TAF4-domain-containing protein [Schizophyllum commune Loenen D]|nr:TAF4-domain-containing protein [Schizophyllum commune Loenen D]
MSNVKSEDTPQPLSQTATPAPQYAQWSQTPVQQTTLVPTRQPTAAPVQAAPAAGQAGGVDTTDVATLNDALGSAGVDLRAEEESLQRTSSPHSSYRMYADQSRKQPIKPSFNTHYLQQTMYEHAKQHKITRIPEDSVNYLALALRARLQDIIADTITAARHRTNSQFDRAPSFYENGEDGQKIPMWSMLIRRDIGHQLRALERVEREEEMRVRKERKERLDAASAQAAALAAQAGSPTEADIDWDDGGARKKRKKDTISARNMPADVGKKMSNAAANMAAGVGGKYAWMNAANASAPAKQKAAAAPSPPASAPSPGGGAAAGTTSAAGGSGWATRPFAAKKPESMTPTPAAQPQEPVDTRLLVKMKDAMFVLAKEKGHGGGRGSARGWT